MPDEQRPMDRTTTDPGASDQRENTSMTEQAREQASDMAGKAQDAASDIAHKAEELAPQARERAYEAAESGRESAAGALDRAASAMEQRAEGGGVAAMAAGRAAEGMQASAGYLKEHDTAEVWDDVERYVRTHPVQAVAAAVVTGIVVGRVLR